MISGKSEAGDSVSTGTGAAKTGRFDWSEEDAVAMSVVDTVSAVTGQEPTEMRPLAEVIDSEALGMLFTSSGRQRETNYVQFEYEGCLVRVSGDGSVTATPEE